jgi:hypothetical protein
MSGGRSTVRIIVTDSGKGISARFLKSQLFSPFAQEDALQAGTGLGMSIVKQVVERLGGQINVTSQIGVGTQVNIDLPGTVVQHAADHCSRVRSLITGMKVFITGFNREEPAGGMLYDSIVGYLVNWFAMQVVDDLQSSDLIISDECPELYNYFQTGRSARQSDRVWVGQVFETSHPLIVLCSNALRYEFYGQQPGTKIVDFATKPCGPSKLARSLLVCLRLEI